MAATIDRSGISIPTGTFIMQLDAHREVLNEIQQEIAALNERLGQLQAVADYHASKLNGSKLPDSRSHTGNGQRSGLSARLKNRNQREAAAIVISESEKPMRVGDIARTLMENGYPHP